MIFRVILSSLGLIVSFQAICCQVILQKRFQGLSLVAGKKSSGFGLINFLSLPFFA